MCYIRVMPTHVRIPKRDLSRNIVYFDESGTASFKGNDTYYVLTGVIAKTGEFRKFEEYYFTLKKKYFGRVGVLHATEIFNDYQPKSKTKAQLFRIKKYRHQYIEELAAFIDNLPFVYITRTLNKKIFLQNTSLVSFNPNETKFNVAYSLLKKQGDIKTWDDFKTKNIQEIMQTLKTYKIPKANNYLPLELTLKSLLEEYFMVYQNKFRGLTEICYESSPNQAKILNLFEKFKQELDSKGNKTDFAKKFTSEIYSVSFPNKKAKYMGLEIADLISYGYFLKANRRITANKYYQPIWKSLQKRRLNITRELNGLKMYERLK